MQNYVLNLLPRLREFNQTLDKKEILIDQPWVLTGDHSGKQQFIFRRNGQLIQSVNGHAEMGTWEYIAAAKSLLIQSDSTNLLLNHAFFDKGVLLLRKDGSEEAPWMLANEHIIPDLDVEKYLKNLIGAKDKLGWLQLTSGEEMEFDNPFSSGIQEGAGVRMDGMEVPNGTYISSDDKLCLEVSNSSVTRLYIKNDYLTDKGTITIQEISNQGPPLKKGLKVWLGQQPAPTNRYTFEDEQVLVKYVDVENGVIIKVKNQFNEAVMALFLVIGVLILLFVIDALNK
jgi:hypothetical protein